MENLQRLLNIYRQTAIVGRLQEFLNQDTPGKLHLHRIVGSVDAFYLAALTLEARQWNHLYIARDKEEAAYVQNNLAGILPELTTYFFPDSFKYPLNFEHVNRTNVLTRSETMHQIAAESAGQLIVTYPEALFEKVVHPDLLKKSRIDLSVNDQIDLDFLIEILVNNGFERTDFVYEPGQFSIRGGIVDIFSFGNEHPYRIELFDEEVENIRIFDPLSQLSVRSLRHLRLVPNLNSQFTPEQKVSLLEVLQENTIIWLQDTEYLVERLQFSFEKLGAFAKIYRAGDEGMEATQLFQDRTFIFPHEIMDGVGRYPQIYLSPDNLAGAVQTVPIQVDPQPSFNKNFSLLINSLQKLEREGMEIFLFTENTKQIERFYRIFADLNANFVFHPITQAIHQGFIDRDQKVVCFTDHQIFERYHRYNLRKGFSKEQALKLRMLRELEPGDFVTHIDYGIGRYSGLEKITINDRTQESVRLIYKNNDVLYVSINALHKISKYVGKEGTEPQLSRIGGDAWNNIKRKTKRKIKDIAKELILLYAKRKASPGHAFPPDGYLQTELEASFIYEDTPDQFQSTIDVKEDMQKAYPMDRLICGDVGFGKTEVAIRAAFKAVADGKQVAVLVPTTILALQHFNTFSERLKDFGVTIEYLNRFRSTKEKKEIFEKINEGKIEVIIGTHSLLNKEIVFKDLGLLVIDEEQKFGVAAKEKIRNLRVNVDTLVLTATPIPRTLQFSLMAARDLSIIRTPPPNRQPIHTERRVFNDDLIRESIYYEVNRGGQVFFVHNRVKNLVDIQAMLMKLCPDLEIRMAHGQMEPKLLEKTLMAFIHHEIDVLVSTNIIETGLDIPNANTIIINNAHHFGLSDLHQLRGRVGRSNRKAFCYLFCPPLSVLTSDARKRLQTLEEFSDLGSGFDIAMRDLDIRGAGNLLGAEQSGFISDIGYETYQKILDEAIQELKEKEFKDLFEDELAKQENYIRDVQIETDTEMHIPDDYVSNVQERLRLYTELDQLETEEEIKVFQEMLDDRFGPVPEPVFELFEGLRLRWIARKLGFERLSLKTNKLRCYFTANQQSLFFVISFFKKTLYYLSKYSVEHQLTLKQSAQHLILVRDKIHSLKEAASLLVLIHGEIKAIEEVPPM